MQPPQTYSRLFRPWDTHKSHINDRNEQPLPAMVKTEYGASDPLALIKSERNTNDSERECASCSSSTKSCYDEVLSSSLATRPAANSRPLLQLAEHSPRNISPAEAATAVFSTIPIPQLFGSMEQQPQLQHNHHLQPHIPMMPCISPTNDLYYAAATAAAVNNILPSPHAPSTFGMDPYTLSLMEQEYARVMAEDAHLKALNARKQRPKKFKCPHCEVAFSNNGQLKGHIRIHTGERPFKCDVETCSKTFTRNEELTRHKRIHTGLRPYPCTACGKKFGRRDHLKKHMKTHMPQERQMGAAIFVPMYPYLYGY